MIMFSGQIGFNSEGDINAENLFSDEDDTIEADSWVIKDMDAANLDSTPSSILLSTWPNCIYVPWLLFSNWPNFLEMV